jgi:hypothetical protein
VGGAWKVFGKALHFEINEASALPGTAHGWDKINKAEYIGLEL